MAARWVAPHRARAVGSRPRAGGTGRADLADHPAQPRQGDADRPPQPFLLRTAHDERLFKHYTTAQLAIVAPGRAPRADRHAGHVSRLLGQPRRQATSCARRIDEPLSYLVGFNGFGRRLDVIDLDGRVLAEIRQRPLQEAQSRGGDPARRQPSARGRMAARRQGSVAALARERAAAIGAGAAPRQDRLMLLAPPFDLGARADDRLDRASHQQRPLRQGRPLRIHDAGQARPDRCRRGRRDDLVAYDLTGAAAGAAFVLKANIDPDDPADAARRRHDHRHRQRRRLGPRVSRDGASVFLEGDGLQSQLQAAALRRSRRHSHRQPPPRSSKARPTPSTSRSSPLDPDVTRLIVSRESKTTHPDSYLWTRARRPDGEPDEQQGSVSGDHRRRARRLRVRAARRRQGAGAHLAAGRTTGRARVCPPSSGPIRASSRTRRRTRRGAIRARNHNAYTPLSFLRWSDIWLTQGYALVYPDIPILGKDGKFNDNYRPHLVDTMYAAIRKVDELGYVDVNRIGHGGHSYGAFTTANLLAHTPFFKAGIAGDGAYNRTLTPMTFQGERRNFWEAPTTYTDMSPFFYADQINAPLLMYHGAQDNNCGTFIIQSERMMQALTGLGKTAVLYIYPFESHAPRARGELPRSLGALARMVRQVRQERGIGAATDDGAIAVKFKDSFKTHLAGLSNGQLTRKRTR